MPGPAPLLALRPEDDGFVKVLADKKTDKLLGVRIVAWLPRPFRPFSVLPFCRFGINARSIRFPAFRFAVLANTPIQQSCFPLRAAPRFTSSTPSRAS